MSAGAVPGIAIPLLQDGCANTSVDLDWVWDAIYDNSSDPTRRLNLEQLRGKVEACFSPASLKSVLAPSHSQAEKICLDWLSRGGKRWRPFLAVCTYQALCGGVEESLPRELVETAVAVECFHKASLIHDDIEDGDVVRYDGPALHTEHGVPIAINAGDLLLGEGYRLIANLSTGERIRVAMLQAAARGHRDLCVGQGMELAWVCNPRALSCDDVVDIYRKKTAPAFEVALNLGAFLAGAIGELGEVFSQYSEALGVAYQIRDDIEDFCFQPGRSGSWAPQPSLLLALACERAKGWQKKMLESAWLRPGGCGKSGKVARVLEVLDVVSVAMAHLESYKSRAIAALSALENASIKGLLRRVILGIFRDTVVMGCCNEHKKRDGTSRKPRPEDTR